MLDSTAIWRIQRSRELSDGWADEADVGALGSCLPQRLEFRRSARNLDEFEQMSGMFSELYPDVPVPKVAWSWVDSAQFRLASRGRHQALSVVDWLVCATAAHHDLVVLHDDRDFHTASELLPDLREHNVHDLPPAGDR
ncbi:PIN domain-containing protein [Microlunatus elymi]|uniref:PIN domain-containing protein n=1 Tax=Microlunatus elymi TaxID=2596828 RepID=UPI001AEFA093|nr:PIN domain-containing protein [Microlunatus elymi]